jgi:hypothetical protein
VPIRNVAKKMSSEGPNCEQNASDVGRWGEEKTEEMQELPV